MGLLDPQRAPGHVFAGGLVKEHGGLAEIEADAAVDGIVHVAEDHGGEHDALGVQLDGGLHAGGQGGIDHGLPFARVADVDMLGPHAQHHVFSGEADRLIRSELRLDVAQGDGGLAALHLRRAVDKVDGGIAHEVRHEQVGGVIVHFQRRRVLLQQSALHDAHAGGQGHGLQLVVSHIDEGAVRIAVQPLELGAHLHAQLGVQVGKGLVHKQDLRSRGQGAGDGHALLLAAAELRGIALFKLPDAQHLQ